jgi:hypothetical protein
VPEELIWLSVNLKIKCESFKDKPPIPTIFNRSLTCYAVRFTIISDHEFIVCVEPILSI